MPTPGLHSFSDYRGHLWENGFTHPNRPKRDIWGQETMGEEETERLQLQAHLVECGLEVDKRHTPDRGHINSFDVQAMRLAYERYKTPRRYVRKIVNELYEGFPSAEEADGNFCGAVSALDSGLLLVSEVFKILVASGNVEVIDFIPGKIREYKQSFEAFRQIQRAVVGDAESVRPFIQNVLQSAGMLDSDYKPDDTPPLLGILREFLIVIDLAYLQTRASELDMIYHLIFGDIQDTDQDFTKFQTLKSLQTRLVNNTSLACDLIEGRYEPCDNKEGLEVLAIALYLLSGRVSPQITDCYTPLRHEVVRRMAASETSCDDIFSRASAEEIEGEINPLLVEVNLVALLGDKALEADVVQQSEAFHFYREAFLAAYPHPPEHVQLSPQNSTRWKQLDNAYGLQKKRISTSTAPIETGQVEICNQSPLPSRSIPPRTATGKVAGKAGQNEPPKVTSTAISPSLDKGQGLRRRGELMLPRLRGGVPGGT